MEWISAQRHNCASQSSVFFFLVFCLVRNDRNKKKSIVFNQINQYRLFKQPNIYYSDICDRQCRFGRCGCWKTKHVHFYQAMKPKARSPRMGTVFFCNKNIYRNWQSKRITLTVLEKQVIEMHVNWQMHYMSYQTIGWLTLWSHTVCMSKLSTHNGQTSDSQVDTINWSSILCSND